MALNGSAWSGASLCTRFPVIDADLFHACATVEASSKQLATLLGAQRAACCTLWPILTTTFVFLCRHHRAFAEVFT